VSIGQTLIAAREEAGMSVEQVAESTRIRQTLVRAIEHDDYRLCGGDFYTRGHIRSLARTIGLDPTPLIAEFDQSARATPAPRATAVYESEAASHRERRSGPNWSAAMAAVLVLVVVYGVAQAVTGGSGANRRGGTASDPSPAVSNTAPAKPSPSPSATNPSALAQAARGRVTVQVRANGRSWLQASTAGGKELFQGVLQAGQVKTFTDKQKVKLVVGNAGAVGLTVNGTEVGAPGRSGQVVRVQFGPQDPAAG
jgi:cytoskeleton protein RodZ